MGTGSSVDHATERGQVCLLHSLLWGKSVGAQLLPNNTSINKIHLKNVSTIKLPRKPLIILMTDVYLFICMERSVSDTSESSQGIIIIIFLDFIGPTLKHFFSYYYTIFKLILFQYDTSFSNIFCRIID